ncbi:unnamed protein product [Pedinophyceae sp. YPF-701]|nr:unnamed protein product [Pedinophyceae sp. YPF-701]
MDETAEMVNDLDVTVRVAPKIVAAEVEPLSEGASSCATTLQVTGGSLRVAELALSAGSVSSATDHELSPVGGATGAPRRRPLRERTNSVEATEKATGGIHVRELSSQSASREGGTLGPPPGPFVATVEDLQMQLDDPEIQVVDLRGGEVRGRNATVEITRSGVTLRGGVLRGVKLVVHNSAESFRLDGVKMKGTESAFRWPPREPLGPLNGALEVCGARGVVVRRCAFTRTGFDSGILAKAGAQVFVKDTACDLNFVGIAALGGETKVTMSGATCSNNGAHGVHAHSGAQVTMEGGECSANCACGLLAMGAGTTVVMRYAACCRNKGSGINAQCNARVVGRGVFLRRNRFGNVKDGLGAVVDLQ